MIAATIGYCIIFNPTFTATSTQLTGDQADDANEQARVLFYLDKEADVAGSPDGTGDVQREHTDIMMRRCGLAQGIISLARCVQYLSRGYVSRDPDCSLHCL